MDSKGQKFEFPASSESDAMLSSEAALPRLKQLEERQVETAVELMAWSPKMDILALAMKSGDLQLCRAAGNWQKIWSAAPPSVKAVEGGRGGTAAAQGGDHAAVAAQRTPGEGGGPRPSSSWP